MKAKNESIEWELEGKLPLFSTFLFFFMVFFAFLLLEKKKMLGESVWNKKVKVAAKSEKAERELESKIPPFFLFFFFCVFYLFCVWQEEDDNNVPSSSFVVVL